MVVTFLCAIGDRPDLPAPDRTHGHISCDSGCASLGAAFANRVVGMVVGGLR